MFDLAFEFLRLDFTACDSCHTDSEQYDGAVELRTVDEDQPVMTVRLAQTAASSTGWTKLGIVASRQMQARLAPDVEIQDAEYSLSNALYLLN